MQDYPTHSWIFLATALAAINSKADRKSIALIADGINHAVPSEKEMSTSLKWLMLHGLIVKKENEYMLTSSGKEFYEAASIHSEHLLDIWNKLATTFSKRDEENSLSTT